MDRRAFFRQVEEGTISAQEFCDQLAQQAQAQSNFFGDKTPEFSFEQAKWGWMGYFKPVPERNLRNLLALKEKYQLFLLSNTNPFIMAWACSDEFGNGHPIDYYFHRLFCSYQLHDYKPSPTIFQKALQLAGIKAEESVFLDDSPTNVQAALSQGLQAILVQHNEDWMPALEKLLSESNA